MTKQVFVVQKHDAKKMHYDFRLEIDGVLKSWAVPKGPSTDPREKRLAIETEDHKLSYKNFEGVIPEGEYGAGTVLLWDKGTYKTLKEDEPLSKSYKNGHLTFWLKGKKLEGGYSLVKMKNRKKQWLLVKMDDEKSDARKNLVQSRTESVKSGKKSLS